MGGKLLAAGELGKLRMAAMCDRLRLGAVKSAVDVTGTQRRRCLLCADTSSGLPHLLAECLSCNAARQVFLESVDLEWRASLCAAQPGDWPPVVLSPHLALGRLAAAATYGAAVFQLLQEVAGAE